MAYDDYKTFKTVASKFNLEVRHQQLFNDIEAIEASKWLEYSLELASSLPVLTSKAKSERFISPILLEVYQSFKDKLTFFSGVELDVDFENGLCGECDFLFSTNRTAYLLEEPIFSISEAKKENFDYGIAKCTAQMLGIQSFYIQKQETIPVIWGCSTSVGEWKFLKLTDKILYIHSRSYTISQLHILLGVFYQIFKSL